MRSTIIIDSSALVSLALPDDSNNDRAIKISHKILNAQYNLIIPCDIFSETINVLGKKTDHKGAAIIGEEILTNKRFTIQEASFDTRQHALKMFKDQVSSVSFTDCLVMAFADEYETKEIFGFDETFSKNGYTRFGVDKSREE